FSIALPPSPTASVGQPYTITPTASGNVGTVAWAVASGPLPVGFSIDPAAGTISGTPVSWGELKILVQGTDSGSARVDTEWLTIVVAPTPLSVSTTTMPSGIVRQAYQATLAAVGGTGAATWTLSGGTLPGGLLLASNGAITGTPTTTGTSTFTVKATDAGWAGNVATQLLSISVGAREVVLYAS